MQERDRRLAIFGDFDHISKSDVEKIRDKYKKRNFLLSDYPTEVTLNTTFENGRQVQQRTETTTVPMLVSDDEDKIEIIFDKKHIFMRENIADIDADKYKAFQGEALDMITYIISMFKIRPNRLACSGSFTDMSEKRAGELFEKFFANDISSLGTSEEWELSVNSKKQNKELDCQVNHIIRAIRGREIIGTENNIPVGPVVVVYDCNTDLSAKHLFAVDDLKKFTKEANKFREKVLEI